MATEATTPASTETPAVVAETPAAETAVKAEPVEATAGKNMKLPQPLSLDKFELGVTLGTGSFGRVRFATHKETNTYWAIKMLKKAEVIRLQQVSFFIF